MAYLVLARKYRPQAFEEVVGQEHVTLTLRNSVLNNRVAHSILLSGPRGTGKTTIARILAKVMNCKSELINRPCNKCKACIDIGTGRGSDIFEIDGASNNSVDQIRTLQENIRYMPSANRLKIYIMDEVHMLSGAAFNALLKTLEEPPKHIMFILATTEYHKIPATITSRCQHHNLRQISIKNIVTHLSYLSKMENFEITDESLRIISTKVNGSMRDAISLLDQVISCYNENTNQQQIIDIIGVVDNRLIHNISEAVFLKDTMSVLNQINLAYEHGHDLKQLYNSILQQFRHLLILKISKNDTSLVNLPSHEIKIMQKQIKEVSTTYIEQILFLLFKEEANIKSSICVKLALEIAFLKLHNMQPVLSIDTLIGKLDNFKKANLIHKNLDNSSQIKMVHNKKDQMENPRNESGKNDIIHVHSSSKTLASNNQNNAMEETWKQVQSDISKLKPALAANLSHCSIRKTKDNSLEIEVTKNEYTLRAVKEDFDFVKKSLQKLAGNKTIIKLKSNIQKYKKQNLQHHDTDDNIANHSLVADTIEIFGGTIENIKINTNNQE